MSDFSYTRDFDIPFSVLEEEDQAWLMNKVWAHLSISNCEPTIALPPRYTPKENSKVYQVWRNLREDAEDSDLEETTNWWISAGFARITEEGKSVLPSPHSACQTAELNNAPSRSEVPESIPENGRRTGEIVDHFLNHSEPLTDPQTLLLMFRWFELNTSIIEFQSGHFRQEIERRSTQLKNLDATLIALEKKKLIRRVASSPRKIYKLSKPGRAEVQALIEMCPGSIVDEEDEETSLPS